MNPPLNFSVGKKAIFHHVVVPPCALTIQGLYIIYKSKSTSIHIVADNLFYSASYMYVS